MKFITPQDKPRDPWHAVNGDDGPMVTLTPAPHSLLTLLQWLGVRSHWPAGMPVGVVLANDVELTEIAADLPRLQLIALQFPKWTDGRAYSQARVLRSRYRYAGEVRATGEVLVDMLPLLQRTGFDAVAMRADQSVALIGTIGAHYGLNVEVYRPANESVVHFVREHGERAMYQSIELRKGCCGIRKLEPLSRMLAERSAWVTGMRREQSNNRGTVEFSETDDKGRAKFNPLADWSWADVWHYISLHGVPYNPLHDEFMPSIGCEPCTRAIAVGEDFRAGRWWWESEDAKECGLHVHAPEEDAAPISMLGTHR